MPRLQAPLIEPLPHWVSDVQLSVQTPFAVSHVEVPPNAEQLAVTLHVPNWNTPVGPAGERARAGDVGEEYFGAALVPSLSMLTDATWFGKQR